MARRTAAAMPSASRWHRDLVVELEQGRRADAVEIMRGAWGRFRDVIASHEEAADEA
jgi:hypothetical protein